MRANDEAADLWSTGLRRLLPVAIPTLLAVLTTFFWIGRESLWLDEAHSTVFAAGTFRDLLGHTLSGEANMALYYVVLQPWMKLGNSEVWLRSLSAVFAILTVPVVFSIARRVAGVRAGFAASLLLAGNFFFIHCAQEVRTYPLALLLASSSTLLLFRVVEEPRFRRWAIYVAVSVLSVYAHTFCVLVLLSHGVATLVRPERPGLRRKMIVAGLSVGILVLPLVIAHIVGGHGNLGWVEKPGLEELIGYLVHLSGSPLLLAAYFVATAAVLWCRARAPAAWKTTLLLCWLLVPVTTGFLFSLYVPVFEDRYFFFSLPALTILGGVAISLLRRRAAAAVALVILLSLSVEPTLDWYRTLYRENWRAATQLILADSGERDLVGFYDYSVERPYDYYVARSIGTARAPVKVSLANRVFRSGRWQAFPDLDEIDALGRRGARFWLVLSHFQGAGDEPTKDCETIVNRLDSRYLLLRQTSFRGVVVRLYDLIEGGKGRD